MSNFQRELNEAALKHVSTLSALRMDKKNYNQYLEEIGHSSYFGVGRELPVVLDESVDGIEFDLSQTKSPVFVKP